MSDVPACYALIAPYCSFSKGEAFKDDKWHWQTRMMDAMLTALDRALVGFTYVLFVHPTSTSVPDVIP